MQDAEEEGKEEEEEEEEDCHEDMATDIRRRTFSSTSLWCAIAVQVLRAMGDEKLRCVEDSVDLTVALWSLAGFLDDLANRGSNDARTEMCARLMTGDGLSRYAAKFFLQSMRALYRHIGPERCQWRIIEASSVHPR